MIFIHQFQYMTKTFLVLITLIIATLNYSYGSNNNRINQAASFEIPQDGLDIIANEVSTRYLTDIKNLPLKKIKDKAKYGVKVNVTGIKAHLNFNSFNLFTKDNEFEFKLKIDSIRLDLKRIHLEKYIIAGNVTSTCTKTSIIMGEKSPIYYVVRLKPSIENNVIKLNEQKIKFNIDAKNYRVRGPKSCSGSLVGNIISNVVHDTLIDSKKTIEKQIINESKKYIKLIEEELNKIATQSIEISINDLLPMNNNFNKIFLKAYPESLILKPGKLLLNYSADLLSNRLSNLSPRNESSLTRLNQEKYLGSVSLNRDLFNISGKILFDKVIQDTEIIVDNDFIPDIENFLTLDFFKTIIPGLKNIKFPHSTVSAYLKIMEFPNLTFDQYIHLNVPNINLTFNIEHNGHTINLANFSVKMLNQFELFSNEKEFFFKFFNGEAQIVQWNVGKDIILSEQNINPMEFYKMIDHALMYLKSFGKILKIPFMTYDIFGAKIKFKSPRVEKNKIKVDLFYLK